MRTEDLDDDAWATTSDENSRESILDDEHCFYHYKDISITQWAEKYPNLTDASRSTHRRVGDILLKSDNELAKNIFQNIVRVASFKFEDFVLILNTLWAILRLFSTDYTIWAYRRCVLKRYIKHLSNANSPGFIRTLLCDELEMSKRSAERTPKNFQIWNDRKELIQLFELKALVSCSMDIESLIHAEKVLCTQLLEMDPKNYHVWSYRKWCVQQYDSTAGELDYTTRLIQQDVFNNSAWTYRYFLITSNFNILCTNFNKEIARVIRSLCVAPGNESSLSYALGLCMDRSQSTYNIEKCRHFYECLKNFWKGEKICHIHEEFLNIEVKTETDRSNEAILWMLHDLAKILNLSDSTSYYAQMLCVENSLHASFWLP